MEAEEYRVFENIDKLRLAARQFQEYYRADYNKDERAYKDNLLAALNKVLVPYIRKNTYTQGVLLQVLKEQRANIDNVLGSFYYTLDLVKYLELEQQNEMDFLEQVSNLLDESKSLEDRIAEFKELMDAEYRNKLFKDTKPQRRFPLNEIVLLLAAYDPIEYSLFRATSYSDAIKEFGYYKQAPVFRNEGVRYTYHLAFLKDVLEELERATGLKLDLLDAHNFVFWWTWKTPKFSSAAVKRILDELKAKGWWSEERIQHRRDYEEQARKLYRENAGNMTEAEASELFDLMDSDYELKKMKGRFGGAFYAKNKEAMLEDMKEFNKWASSFNEAEGDEAYDVLSSYVDERKLKGARIGMPSIFLHLKDNKKYCIMFPRLAKGLEKISNYIAPSAIKSEHYKHFNEFALRLQKEFDIPPEMTDLVLYYAADYKDELKAIPDLYAHFTNRGFHFPPELITNYFLCLKTKPFVILSGISGTGKTKIAQLFAEYMCPPEQVEVIEVPENTESEFYAKVTRGILNSGILTISAALEEYFDIPEPSQSNYVTLEFAKETEKARIHNVGFTDVKQPEHVRLSFWKKARAWIKEENFEMGDVLKVSVAGKDGDAYRLEKVMPQTKTVSARRSTFISVRPDWMDNRGLLGFYNILTGEYQPTELLKLMLRAAEDPHRPYFVVLDEMNLARVEYYFSDFLSCLESRSEGEEGKIRQEPIILHDREEDLEYADKDGTIYYIPSSLEIPTNLYFTGTVNIDETTYMFSPKVLDRANTIEFNQVDLEGYGTGEYAAEVETAFLLRPGSDDPALFSSLELAGARHYRELDSAIKGYLEEINSLLRPYHLHFGYRVANEIALYVKNGRELAGEDSDLTALDFQILQKILPKFHGSRQKLEEPLLRLLLFCMGKEQPPEPSYDSALEEYGAGQDEIPFPRTARKLCRMLRTLGEQGFVSFVE